MSLSHGVGHSPLPQPLQQAPAGPCLASAKVCALNTGSHHGFVFKRGLVCKQFSMWLCFWEQAVRSIFWGYPPQQSAKHGFEKKGVSRG